MDLDIIKLTVKGFLLFYIQMKTYHFQTKIYNRHYNVDTFLEEYSKLYDRFVEVCMGKFGIQNMGDYELQIRTVNDDNIFEIVNDFNLFLHQVIKNYAEHSVLINICDEIEAEVNLMLYKLRLI
jgi:hypothetical protein